VGRASATTLAITVMTAATATESSECTVFFMRSAPSRLNNLPNTLDSIPRIAKWVIIVSAVTYGRDGQHSTNCDFSSTICP
jgi:hypothetical protein